MTSGSWNTRRGEQTGLPGRTSRRIPRSSPTTASPSSKTPATRRRMIGALGGPAIPPTARRRHIHHGRRDGDDSDLQGRARTAGLRLLRPPRRRGRDRGLAGLLRRLRCDREAPRLGIVLDTPTWRANHDWGARLGYSEEALDDVNRRGVGLLEGVRAEAGDGVVMVISGCIGPPGDGY